LEYRLEKKVRDDTATSHALFSQLQHAHLQPASINPFHPFAASPQLLNPYLVPETASLNHAHYPYNSPSAHVSPYPSFTSAPEHKRAYCMQILADKGVPHQEIASLFRTSLDRDLTQLTNSGQLQPQYATNRNNVVGRESQSYNDSQNSGNIEENLTSAFLSRMERNVEEKLENLFKIRSREQAQDATNRNNVVGRESQSYNDSQNSGNEASAFFQNIARNVEQSIENTLHNRNMRCFKCDSDTHRIADCPKMDKHAPLERCTLCRCVGHKRKDCLTDMSKPRNRNRVTEFDRHESETYNRDENSRRKPRYNGSGQQKSRRTY
jgi:hypothetical protein